MVRAALLYGNGGGMTTSQLEEGMSAPDAELLEFVLPYIQELNDDRMAYAVGRALMGER
ncbi:MAG: hypothetical protein A4E31_00407 [Methanomassiliicoccales archaeon PtaU1.Bin030]|nr:MAG: hypothetical protein A4E31_00407 [Methanomassiliicoccales archaeon PtaU1.Bin030]